MDGEKRRRYEMKDAARTTIDGPSFYLPASDVRLSERRVRKNRGGLGRKKKKLEQMVKKDRGLRESEQENEVRREG